MDAARKTVQPGGHSDQCLCAEFVDTMPTGKKIIIHVCVWLGPMLGRELFDFPDRERAIKPTHDPRSPAVGSRPCAQQTGNPPHPSRQAHQTTKTPSRNVSLSVPSFPKCLHSEAAWWRDSVQIHWLYRREYPLKPTSRSRE